MCFFLIFRLEFEGGDLLFVDCGVVGGDFFGESNVLFFCLVIFRLFKVRVYRKKKISVFIN